MENTKKKFPFGFYVCSLTFTFERLAYYAAKWGLAVFIALEASKGGLGMDQATGAVMNSNLVAFTYITPIIGGIIADRWISPRILVPVGEILMGIGWLCMWQANGIGMVWMAIILVSIGTGFFKGNVSGINGRLFPLADPDTLDTVFNLQYSFVNIGSFIGTTFITMIATNISYRLMFLVCGIFLFIDCVWWFIGMGHFGEVGKKPFKHDNRVEDGKAEAEEAAPLTKLEKNRVIGICLVTFLSGVFWLWWYLIYMPVYYQFGPIEQAGWGWANWNIGSFQMPTAWFDSMNGLLCIILCPIFAGIWAKMKQRPQGDWGMLTKTAVGILILGLSLASMVLAAYLSGEGTKDPVGIWVIILTAVCMSVGEVVFSPLGNAFISKYSPKKLLGTMLGVWPFIIFFSGKAYGPLYNWLGNFSFVKAYGIVTIIVIAIGLVMLAFSKKFNEFVGGK